MAGVPGGRYRIMIASSRRNLHTAAKILMACGLRQKVVLVGSAGGSGEGSSNITGILGCACARLGLNNNCAGEE